MDAIPKEEADFRNQAISQIQRHVLRWRILNGVLLAAVVGPALFGHEYPLPWRVLKIVAWFFLMGGIWKQREAASDLKAAKL